MKTLKKQTEVVNLNSNINLLLAEGKIIAAVEMSQGIINMLRPFDIDNFILPKNYETFTVIHLLATHFLLQGYQND